MKKLNIASISSLNIRKVSVKKLIFAVAVIAALISIVSGFTVAYVFVKTPSVENVFANAHVACEVNETFENNVKSNVYISNTGDVKSYIRAAVVVTWMSEDQTKVTARKPVEDTDYVISYNTDDWELASDGYWYYIMPVEEGTNTADLISSCSLAVNADVPDGFYLSVEIVASSIQAEPSAVVISNWQTGVSAVESTSGKLSIIK